MRTRAIVGGLAGTLMLLSAAAHGFLGWPALRAELSRTTAPPDLVAGLGIGWWFGSVAMAAFAAIVLHLAWQLWRDQPVSLAPAAIVGAAYVLFGAVAIALQGASPPMISFVVLGALLTGMAARRT
jgi:hypothetical protein